MSAQPAAIEQRVGQEATLAQPAAWLEIDLACLRHNAAALRAHLGPAARLLAVVKADAYGHGLIPIARALAGRVEYFGVGPVEEGLVLRRAGVTTPILVFSPLPPSSRLDLGAHDLTFTVSADWQLDCLRALAEERRRKIAVHVKIDTGMGRLGVPHHEALALLERVLAEPLLVLEGLMTHFPDADSDPPRFAHEQLARFSSVVEKLAARGIQVPYLHAANSSGILNVEGAGLTLARPGLALYGVLPHEALRSRISLRPILSFFSKVAFLKSLAAGETVSYGRTYRAKRATTLAVVPVGYAHGYPFAASGRASVLLNGVRSKIAGRVCMDCFMVEVPRGRAVHVGDPVTLIGGPPGLSALRAGGPPDRGIRVEDVARWSKTIPYEILTRLHPLIPRQYRDAAP